MPVKLPVYNQNGENIRTEDAPDALFNIPVNHSLIYQVYTAKRSNMRRNYAHTKIRSEVRGGGRKPWRQKGTGRARHGSNRSPIWIGGGITFGPRNEKVFRKSVNKKMNKKAIASVLSSKAKEGRVFVVDTLSFEEPKTKHAVNLINELNINSETAVVYGTEDDKYLRRVFNNLNNIKPVNVNNLNIVDILERRNCIFSASALEKLEEGYANQGEKEKDSKTSAAIADK